MVDNQNTLLPFSCFSLIINDDILQLPNVICGKMSLQAFDFYNSLLLLIHKITIDLTSIITLGDDHRESDKFKCLKHCLLKYFSSTVEKDTQPQALSNLSLNRMHLL